MSNAREPMLVTRGWAEHVSRKVGAPPKPRRKSINSSAFYKIRRMEIISQWQSDGSNNFIAMARLVDGEGNAASPESYKIIARQDNLPTSQIGDFVQAVYLSGWELLSEDNSETIKPALRTSYWYNYNQSGSLLWAQAYLVNQDGSVDWNSGFQVYSYQGNGEEREFLWVVWRGRWEALQQPQTPRYIGRLGIGVGAYDYELGGYPIDNYGVRSVRVPGESYEDSNGTLYFSPLFFRWTPSSLDIVGKKEINLKTTSRNLVTDVVNGRAVKETFIMLDTQ